MKTRLLLIFLFTFTFHLYGDLTRPIKYMNENGGTIYLKDNEDARYWQAALKRALSDEVLACLPNTWRTAILLRLAEGPDIYVMITSNKLGEDACGGSPQGDPRLAWISMLVY